tara:strand:+ start:308 stop:1432 length:1125 start_codon:yes stop_codon:yes gene_type:complete
MKNKVPFNKPYHSGKELKYIKKAIEMSHISGDGYFTGKCSGLLENALGVKKVLLTTSCSDALEMAAILLDIKEGDEVILPSYTFVSTANAFVLRGAKPIFADIREDTLNIDENLIETLITSKTKAIIVVHYAGVSCEMDKIMDISKSFDIPIIEDNAHGLFAKYKGKYLGTFGDMATQSFHETKNFSCGEGGAIILNKEKYIGRAEILREKGTDRSMFFRGEIDKYSWVDIGSSYLPSDILAAFLYAQLEKRFDIQDKRKKIWDYYFENLKEWALERNFILPKIPKGCEQSFHMFYLILPSNKIRESLIVFLKQKNIYPAFHYIPLHLSKMGNIYNYKEGDLPITEKISNRLLRLPFFNSLNMDDIDFNIFYEF